MNHSYDFRRLYFLIVAVMLAACTQLGLQAPQTFEEKTLVAVNAVDAVLNTSTTLYTAGKIDDADRANVLQVADAAVAGIAVARTIAARDPNAAMHRLTAIITGLSALSAYLATRNGEPYVTSND